MGNEIEESYILDRGFEVENNNGKVQRCKDCLHARVTVPVKEGVILFNPYSPLLEKDKREWVAFCRKEIWKKLDGVTDKVYYTLSSINANSGLIPTFSRGCDHFEEDELDEAEEELICLGVKS